MKRVSVFAAFAAVASGAATAQDEFADDGLYWRVGAGAAFVGDWAQDIAYNPNLVFAMAPPSGQMLSLGDGLTVGGALGFDYADGIRTELEYRYAKTDIDSLTQSGGAAPASTTFPDAAVKAHFLMSNFYFDFANSSRFTPFVGGGVGGAFVANENSDRDAALAYQARAGVSIDLGGDFALDAEYIYLRTNDLSYGPRDKDFTPAGPFEPRVDGDHYHASSVMASFRKKF